MKDFIGQEVNIGDYFAYPLTIGRSAAMAVYRLVKINESGTVGANKIDATYSIAPWRYDEGESRWRDMTPEERAKVDSKISTLKFLNKRAIKLNEEQTKFLHIVKTE